MPGKASDLNTPIKPYRTGRPVSAHAARRALRVLVLSLLSVVVYLFLGQLLMAAGGVWQALLSCAVLLGVGAYLFYEGGAAGEDDVAFSEIVYTRTQAGQSAEARDISRCYHPLKGAFSAFVGVLPLVVPACLLAAVATKQAVGLSALPEWVVSLERSREVALALSYYHETAAVTLENMLRVPVRLVLFPFVTLFGADNAGRMLVMERLSPLLCCLLPACYAAGYLTGPKRRARVHRDIALGRKRSAAKEKKARLQRSRDSERLV